MNACSRCRVDHSSEMPTLVGLGLLARFLGSQTMQPTKSLVMASLLTGFALVGSLLAPAQAGTTARGFVCGSTQGAPSTNAVKPDGGQVPVIRWTSNTFTSAGWSPQRRCEEVSKRFDTYFKQGRLRYITTGRMNSLPVICTATRHAGRCDGLLYTLKPGQNATATLLICWRSGSWPVVR